jgi:hypothetical protein
MKKDEICLETLRLAEQIERIVQHFVEKHRPRADVAVSTPPVWMTEKQLAEYWQLRTPDGEATVHSIRKWTARTQDEHPLPCASMGEMRRYHPEVVDRWAREEAARQREKRGRELKLVKKRAS